MSILGKVLYHSWHRPVGTLRDLIADGGPFERRETENGRRAMEAAAHLLPALLSVPGPAVELHLLTGRRFWDQTAFCLRSFAHHAARPLAPIIYDDGTLTEEYRASLRRLFPASRIVAHTEILARLDTLLPESRFPVLRERWRNYPHIRKLTDPHLGSTGWKLVIDSDLLFFRRPDFLLDWCAAPDRPLHAVDCKESYGYSRNLMEKLAGAPIPPLVNVGLCGLRSEALDWEEIETWCAELIAREKTSYYLEQALVAMQVARTQPCAIAPARDYVTKPDRTEGTQPRAVMHHYVAESKRWYYRHGWREVQRALNP